MTAESFVDPQQRTQRSETDGRILDTSRERGEGDGRSTACWLGTGRLLITPLAAARVSLFPLLGLNRPPTSVFGQRCMRTDGCLPSVRFAMDASAILGDSILKEIL